MEQDQQVAGVVVEVAQEEDAWEVIALAQVLVGIVYVLPVGLRCLIKEAFPAISRDVRSVVHRWLGNSLNEVMKETTVSRQTDRGEKEKEQSVMCNVK